MNLRNFVKLLEDIKLLNSPNFDIEQEAKRDLRIELQAQNELLENEGCVFAQLREGCCEFDRASLLEYYSKLETVHPKLTHYIDKYLRN